MTREKLKRAKRRVAMFMSLSMAVPFVTPVGAANAATTGGDDTVGFHATDDYTLVWNDEFNGTSLNTEDWNVELHDPGWVNAELQSYTDLNAGNIEVSDGTLKIYPKAEKKDGFSSGPADVFDGNGFGEFAGPGASVSAGVATIVIDQVVTNPWDLQFQKAGLSFEAGHTYKLSFKGKATTDRKIAVNIANSEDWSTPIGSRTYTLGTSENEYSFEFTPGVVGEGKAVVQINYGTIDDTDAGSALSTLTLSDLTLIDTSVASSSGSDILGGNSFAGFNGAGAVINNGVATITLNQETVNPWDVQFQQSGLSLVKDHKYKMTFKGSALTDRKVAVNIANSEDWNTPVGGAEFTLGTTESEYSFEFVATAVAEGKAVVQFNLGKIDDTAAGGALTTLTLKDVTVVDLDAETSSGEADPKKDYTYTSGRVNPTPLKRA